VIDHILAGLPFVIWSLDDIIITSSDEQEHLEHPRVVFIYLPYPGLLINAEKFVRGC
jgi:hypothetical protein